MNTPAILDWEKEIRKACGWETNDEEIIVIVRNLLSDQRKELANLIRAQLEAIEYLREKSGGTPSVEDTLNELLALLKDPK